MQSKIENVADLLATGAASWGLTAALVLFIMGVLATVGTVAFGLYSAGCYLVS